MIIKTRKNNWIKFMDVPQLGYVQINDFYIRNTFKTRGGIWEIKSNINDRCLEGPQNAMTL